eukprot:Selendium_serpulae@DN5392_c0_g1_i1.p2
MFSSVPDDTEDDDIEPIRKIRRTEPNSAQDDEVSVVSTQEGESSIGDCDESSVSEEIDDSKQLPEGMRCKVEFPTEHVGWFEEDRIRILSKDTIRLAFVWLSMRDAQKQVNITLDTVAQFAPTMFWSLYRSGRNLDEALVDVMPQQYRNTNSSGRLSRRRRSAINPSDDFSALQALLEQTDGKPPPDEGGSPNGKAKSAYDALLKWRMEHETTIRDAEKLEIERKKDDVYNTLSKFTSDRMKKHKSFERRSAEAYRQDFMTSRRDNLSTSIFLDPDTGYPTCQWEDLSWPEKEELYKLCCDRFWIAPTKLDQNEKGRAVFAAEDIASSHFVAEYKGERITSHTIAKFKEDQYQSYGYGCFQWIVENPFRNRKEIIDSTAEDVDYGIAKLINHSRANPNLVAKRVRNMEDKNVKLALVAKRDIKKGEELLVDYGERRPEVLKANKWLED